MYRLCNITYRLVPPVSHSMLRCLTLFYSLECSYPAHLVRAKGKHQHCSYLDSTNSKDVFKGYRNVTLAKSKRLTHGMSKLPRFGFKGKLQICMLGVRNVSFKLWSSTLTEISQGYGPEWVRRKLCFLFKHLLGDVVSLNLSSLYLDWYQMVDAADTTLKVIGTDL